MAIGIHTAFEAARFLDSTESLGLWDHETLIDFLVDDQDHPVVVVSVEWNALNDARALMPEYVQVGNYNVPVYLKPIDKGLGLN